MPFVYILQCCDRSLHVGSTWDLEQRLSQHAAGRGAVHTSTRLPVELVWFHETERIDETHALERRIHRWSRAKRQALVDGRWDDLRQLARGRDRDG